MARKLGRGARFAKFLALIAAEAGGRACKEALDFYGLPRFAGATFGEAIDALPEVAGPHLAAWAGWCVGAYRQHLTAEVRRDWLLLVQDPKSAYLMLKKAGRTPAGDDWTEEEREILRAVFRGKLPEVPDAETI